MYQDAGIVTVVLTAVLLPSKKEKAASVRETIVSDCKSKVVNALSFTERGL